MMNLVIDDKIVIKCHQSKVAVKIRPRMISISFASSCRSCRPTASSQRSGDALLTVLLAEQYAAKNRCL
jgi:hypothetical protein